MTEGTLETAKDDEGVQDSAQVLEIAEHIELMVRGGKTIASACESLQTGFFKVSIDLVTAGRIAYEKRMKIITIWDDFEPGNGEGGVIKNAAKTWYGGPKEGDFFWPPLKSRLADDIGEAVRDVDAASSRVISLGAKPGDDKIDTRGLVLGYVQSGKTTNFMSVIAKAADVGYKLIVVLSGITDNLRQQTQARIGEYVVQPCVGRFHLLTTDEHDFCESTNPNALLNADDLRLLAVVKKNPARLRRLNAWLKKASAATLTTLPILIIDDEADQASIDVGSKRQSTINSLISELLSHPKAAYVAYTATPFANLLIDPSKKGSLYPRDFVVSLPRPEGYFGPERIFGTLDYEEGQEPNDGMDIVRKIPEDDVEIVRPPKNTVELEEWVAEVPKSLRVSVLWFLLATAARRTRANQVRHSSMLIHTSMRAQAHVAAADSIDDLIRDIRAGMQNEEGALIAEFENLWNSETSRVDSAEFENQHLGFEEIRKTLVDTIDAARVVVDNYLSADRLNYDKESPATVIVVGGNTLSRGLTLEGLISSYFVRSSTAYDTLLQMGRWFGYRQGYEDLVRVWMTNELKQWFMALATVEAEIREEIEVYAREGKTPLELPVKIRSHPQMAVTSAAKMRGVVKTDVSYSGKKIQTILFRDQDKNWLENNHEAVTSLVVNAKKQGHSEDELDSSIYRGFKDIDVQLIMDFLNDYMVHEDARTINTESVRKYIDKQRDQGYLLSWNVVFIERQNEEPSDLKLGLDTPLKLLRRRKMMTNDDGTANLKAITSRWDRVADLDHSKNGIAETFTSGNVNRVSDDMLKLVRQQRGLSKSGLLIVYPINKNSDLDVEKFNESEKVGRIPLNAKAHMLGLGIMFPDSQNRNDLVDYYSANVETGYLEDADSEAAQADELDEKHAEAEEAATT